MLVFQAGTPLSRFILQLLLSFALNFQCARLENVEMIPIKANPRGWCLSDHSLHFASVVDLVMYYQKNSLPVVSPALGIKLSYPVKHAEVRQHCLSCFLRMVIYQLYSVYSLVCSPSLSLHVALLLQLKVAIMYVQCTSTITHTIVLLVNNNYDGTFVIGARM